MHRHTMRELENAAGSILLDRLSQYLLTIPNQHNDNANEARELEEHQSAANRNYQIGLAT